LSVQPAPPHSNSFCVHFGAGVDALERAAVAIARDRGDWLFNRFSAGVFADRAFGEITVGDATLAWTPEQVAAALAELQERAIHG
jgi:hypothetical protein